VATLSDENIRRLNVAVHNSQLVCGIQTIGDLGTQVQDLRQRKRTAGDAVLQHLSVQKLHGDEGLAVFLAYVVDGADVRMI
jgi:hypothetical protein